MIKKIQPTYLSRYICKRGPYVVFCNSECEGKNKELVKYMYTIFHKFKKITFLELNWWHYKSNFSIKSDDEMNHIKLFSSGNLEMSECNPNSQNLLNFFDKCAKLYNLCIDSCLNNVGSRYIQDFKYHNYHENKEDSFINFRKNLYIRRRKRYLLQSKIKISKKLKNNEDESSESISPDWYYNVKFDNLPDNIFENQLENENSYKNKQDQLKLDINVEKLHSINNHGVKSKQYKKELNNVYNIDKCSILKSNITGIKDETYNHNTIKNKKVDVKNNAKINNKTSYLESFMNFLNEKDKK